MSLTSMLDQPTPLRAFMTEELPAVKSLRAAFRAALPAAPAPLTPAMPPGQRTWGSLGTAIDHRLRYALRASISADRPCDHGVALAARYQESLGRAGRTLQQRLDRLAATERLDDRSRPVVRALDVEETLARLCFALSWFEEVFRTGRVWPTTPLGNATSTTTADDLLAAVPAYATADITAVTALADRGLADVRASVLPDQVTLGPTFDGSAHIGGADADWIAGTLLVDVKATVTPAKLPASDVYQLAGYTLLDYNDRYGIDRVGWYLARTGALVTWSLPDFFALLGARRPVNELRARTRELLSAVAVPLPRPARRPADARQA